MSKGRKHLVKTWIFFLVISMIVSSISFQYSFAATSISVQEAINHNAGAVVTVRGYIVGAMQHSLDLTKGPILITKGGDFTQENIVLVDNLNEIEDGKLFPVRFVDTYKEVKEALNLATNPENFGRQVEVTGTLNNPFFMPGLIRASSYSWIPLTIQHTPPEETAVFQKAIKLQITTTGGNGTVTAAVYYKYDEEASFRIASFLEGEAVIPAEEVLQNIQYYIMAEDQDEVVRVPVAEEGTYRIEVLPAEPQQPDSDEGGTNNGDSHQEPPNGEGPNEGESGEREDDDANQKNGEKEKEDNLEDDTAEEKEEGKKSSRNTNTSDGQQKPMSTEEVVEMALGTELVEISQENDVIAFIDIENHWAQEYINALAELGIVRGYKDGSFKPDHPITYGEFITMLMKALDLSVEVKGDAKETLKHWAEKYIAVAATEGIIPDYDTALAAADEMIIEVEMIGILNKVKEDSTFQYSTITENHIITRAEAAMILIGYLDIF
ncbi:S-layer homology domain-containing protein [Natronincola peptidivorans]|uniref:S-layer homology domain-containing protein n=1 Tax=Natronincola peptidivorans TaxID=426128 RepID=A0A1H9ZRG4_9FIRM|nr:S-layer homology domain-containing protein [Natronincola peptidivorans]SES83774.1 S-layer homology domain-containing protein [Natronincola peptidivorans]